MENLNETLILISIILLLLSWFEITIGFSQCKINGILEIILRWLR